MNYPLYNQNADKVGSVSLPDKVFGLPMNEDLLQQVVISQMSNKRQNIAHTKERGDVRGGGKKPWKQKGTGRARNGSIRSPIWRGGGATFGPLNTRNYKQKINKKTKKTAVKMCLSDKVQTSKFIVLENLVVDGKTKTMATLRAALPGLGKTTLLLASKNDEALKRAVNNIPKLDIQTASDVNVIDLLHHQYIITTKDGVKELENRLVK